MLDLDNRISDYYALLGEGTEEGEYLRESMDSRCRAPGSRCADPFPEHGSGKVP